ncbi:hypothetical protein FD754_002848, partial [Muntiacus muntjak]
GGRAGPGGGGDIQPLPAPHAAGGAHPSLLLLDYDGSVLPFLGGLGGGYQKTLVLLTWIPALFIGFSQFSDSFLLDQPNFRCRGAGKGAESAGVTATGRWGGGDLANGTSPSTTPFPTAAWGTAGPLGNGSGADGGETPPLPSPPDKGDNASNCDCHAWDYGIRTGLVQNVVSKVRPAAAPAPPCTSLLRNDLASGNCWVTCVSVTVSHPRRPISVFCLPAGKMNIEYLNTVCMSVKIRVCNTVKYFEPLCTCSLCPPPQRSARVFPTQRSPVQGFCHSASFSARVPLPATEALSSPRVLGGEGALLFLLLLSIVMLFSARSRPILRPRGLQHPRLRCPSPSPGACSNSPSSQ